MYFFGLYNKISLQMTKFPGNEVLQIPLFPDMLLTANITLPPCSPKIKWALQSLSYYIHSSD